MSAPAKSESDGSDKSAGSDLSAGAGLSEIAARLGRIEEALAARREPEQPRGLLSYEDLRDRLTIGLARPHRPSMRTVKELVARHRGIIRPVDIGHRSVGFREASVAALLAHMAGEREGRL